MEFDMVSGSGSSAVQRVQGDIQRLASVWLQDGLGSFVASQGHPSWEGH